MHYQFPTNQPTVATTPFAQQFKLTTTHLQKKTNKQTTNKQKNSKKEIKIINSYHGCTDSPLPWFLGCRSKGQNSCGEEFLLRDQLYAEGIVWRHFSPARSHLLTSLQGVETRCVGKK
jgi:hypothetical protein